MDIQNEIFSIILNSEKTLVFTSETMARNTMASFLSRNPHRAVFKDRFISFDSFLLTLCDISAKRKVTDTERMAFVSSFIKKHGVSYLSYFVDPRYSDSIPSYIRYISKILPFFPVVDEGNAEYLFEEMAEDIKKIRPEYEAYLLERGLYEENYLERDLNRIPEDKIVFVYPESFTSTFADRIIRSGRVEVIGIPQLSRHLPLHEYNNSISEIKAVMRKIERDTLSYSYDEIAITSSSLDTYRPYLEEEAKKRDIPLLFTSKLPLTSYPEGKFLKLLYSLDKSHWGFKDFKKLFSDPSFPFKDRESLLLALRIGIDMKMDGGGYKNWMKAFDIAIRNKRRYEGAEKAKELFISLYKAISLIVKAKKSLDTENRIREFRDTFFLEGEWNEKDDRIFGTALEILEGLKELEDENLYQIFLSILKDTTYVENRGDEKGIKVYSYPASAGLCVKRHYIMGLDDKSTSLKIDDYPFSSSPNKPEPMDIGKSILALYANPGFSEFTYISGTSEGYDGSRLLPTLFLDDIKRISDIEDDSYTKEGESSAIRSTISQSLSYENGKNTALKTRDEKRILEDISNLSLDFSVSQIKNWDACPYKGYVNSILRINKKDYECEMEDHFLVGDILHKTIEDSLEEAKTLDDISQELFQKNLVNAIETAKGEGRIPNEAVEAHIYNSIWRNLKDFKKTPDLDYYGDKELFANEASFSGHVLKDGITLNGRVDTILKDEEGKFYILDYKLSGKSDWSSDNLDDMSLQVILYYMLISSDTGESDIDIDDKDRLVVESGGFYSLRDKKFRIVWPTINSQGFSFDAVLINANQRIQRILEHIEEGDVTPEPSEDNCRNCDYKRLCRGRFVAR